MNPGSACVENKEVIHSPMHIRCISDSVNGSSFDVRPQGRVYWTSVTLLE